MLHLIHNYHTVANWIIANLLNVNQYCTHENDPIPDYKRVTTFLSI